jgi:uncharacterized protein DUF932
MNGTLIAHRGAVKVPREALVQIGTPEPTTTWHPIPHGVLVNTLGQVLSSRGLTVKREEYAVQRDGNILFGVLDLAWGETAEYYAALGLRTSNDKTFCIQIAIGLRVIVCDNLAFHGDLIALKRKHTAKLDLVEELTAAIRRYELGYGQYQRQVEFLQRTPWSPREARERIYTAFARRIVPVRLFYDVALPYVEREETCTAWEVLNSFTAALKRLKPSVQFETTVRLGRFFSQPLCAFPAPVQ